MPGSFGTSNTQNGGEAFTTARDKNGFFAHNDAHSPAPIGVGGNGVFGLSTVPNASGVYGRNNSEGTGVTGFSAKGDGTRGDTESSAKNGMVGTNSSVDQVPAGQPGGNGVYGYSQNPNASGVFGFADGGGTGIWGDSPQGDGVRGHTASSDKSGIVGINDYNDIGTKSHLGNGVLGYSRVRRCSGVLGIRANEELENWQPPRSSDLVYLDSGVTGIGEGHGVTGYSNGGLGVSAISDQGTGIFATGKEAAGMFNGDVHVYGYLFKPGGGFRIDHPLDPEKYLQHSFVESPDMMNIYNGNVDLDDNGEACVRMPDWFEALNENFRYQLTCIGAFAPVFVAEEIRDGVFKIAGGKAGMKVSWQVTGIRHDEFAQRRRIKVEEVKQSQKLPFDLRACT